MRAFTLVELMIAMALMTIISTILAAFLKNAQTMYDSTVGVAQVVANSRTALDVIQNDLAKIEQTTAGIPNDLLNQRPFALTLRSIGTCPQADWNTNNEDNFYVTSNNNPVPLDNLINTRCFMSFFATVQFYNAALNRVQSTPARVVYYLKARTQDRPGALLIRRIEPYTLNLAVPNPYTWQQPLEDDICGFVRGVRVYYLDRERQPFNIGQWDQRFVEATVNGNPVPPPLVAPVPPTPTPRPLWEGARNAVVFQLDPNWQTFMNVLFQQKDFLPPAILLELLVTDNQGMTLREVKREITVWTSPVELPIKR